MTIVWSIVAAAGYAIIAWLKSPTPDKFNITRFLATVLVGGAIGAIFFFKHIPIEEQGVLTQLGLFAGIIVTVENIIKAIWRWIKRKQQP